MSQKISLTYLYVVELHAALMCLVCVRARVNLSALKCFNDCHTCQCVCVCVVACVRVRVFERQTQHECAVEQCLTHSKETGQVAFK